MHALDTQYGLVPFYETWQGNEVGIFTTLPSPYYPLAYLVTLIYDCDVPLQC